MSDAADDEFEELSSAALLEHGVMLERCIPAWAWAVTVLLGLLLLAHFVAGFTLLFLSNNSQVAVFLVPFALLCFGLIIPVSHAADHLNSVETW